ncbi:MAG: glycosyl hydrolase [Candidatus Bathyarchaeia archaeon]
MIKKDLFKSPPSEFKGAPFWSINDRLNPEEVALQIDLLNEGGYGGAFFHAREGLATSFLGEEWFKAFEAAVNEAEKLDMHVWIYDELCWPSGFAGGIVPALSARYRAKALVMVPGERAYGGEGVIANFKCKLNNRRLPVNYEAANPEEKGEDYLYLSFIVFVAPPGETWFYGLSYVDLLDQNVVKKFLEVAYAPYVDRFSNNIGKTIPGVFTDEPNISSSRPRASSIIPPRGPRMAPFAVPWTDRLVERFKELNGYSIMERLPEIFFDVGNYIKTRYDFWKTITMLFLEAFSKQIYEWCDKRGLKFTGHYLAEDSLLSQLVCAGAVMPHYEYQHIPGIDHLGMHVWGSLLTAKQVSSVVNQLGKERVLCETYGCTGNYPSFADRKWIGDWLYVMGVNFLNHHLVPYSMCGRRKRDYGLNFHWSQPWWKYNGILEEYFARLSYMLSRGKRIVNVLVIHPIGTAWALYSPLNMSKVAEIDEYLSSLLRSLLSAHIDFDLGDEMLMEKYGKIDGEKLRIGNILYNAIIIPPSVTLSSKTVKILKEFASLGGKLIAIDPTPYLVDGEPNEEIKDLLSKAKLLKIIGKESLAAALEDIPKSITIEGDEDGDVLYHLREDEDGRILFIVNTSRERSHDLRLSANGEFGVEIWDPMSGEQNFEKFEIKNGKTFWSIRLEPIGSKMFVLRPNLSETFKIEHSQVLDKKGNKICEVALNGPWRIKRLNPNILVLDYCRYRSKGAWSDLVPVWKAHETIVRKGLGTEFRLRFEFESDVEFKNRKAYLVIEKPERFKIHVNGVSINPEMDDFWLDWNFPKIDVSNLMGKGLNTIEIEGIVDLEPELENIYLLGDFAVKIGARGGSRLVEEVKEAEIRDLCEAGYPFYAGEFELEKDVGSKIPENARVFLSFEEFNAALAIIYVNEKEAGKVILPPYEIEITDALKRGYNKIKVVLVGTLRNALGPLHYKGGDPSFIGPETFRETTNWTDDYVLRQFGAKNVKMLVFA